MSDLNTQLSAYFDAVVERVDPDEVPFLASADLHPSRPGLRSGWVYALATAAVVLLLGAVSFWAIPREPTTTDEPPADTADTTSLPTGVAALPPVTLGTEHVWPETPSSLSSVEMAELFAEEVLGWDAAGATEFADAIPDGPAWLHIKQQGVEELVDVLTVPSGDGGRIIAEVGTPWARGADLQALDGGGVSVTMLRIVAADSAEVVLRLSDGTHLVGSTSMDLSTTAPIRVEFPTVDLESVGSVLVRYVTQDGTVVAATGTSQAVTSESEATTSTTTSDASPQAAWFDDMPVLEESANARVFLSTDTHLTDVDVDAPSASIYQLQELAGGDPLHRMVERADHLVFYGKTENGPGVFVLDPATPTRPMLIDEAWFFVPSAEEDRVWLAILDESSPETVRAILAVREVTIDGQVTVEDVAPPDGRGPVAAIQAGLIFQGDTTLDVWDPGTGEIVEVLPGPFPVAAWQNRVVTCGNACDQVEIVDLDTGTQQTVELPQGVRSVDGYGGAFSPDGRLVAVPAELGTGQGVVLIAFESGSASVVPGLSHPLGDYPQVAWSEDGEWLFYSVGNPANNSGTLIAHKPGDSTAYRVLTPLDGQYYGIAAR